MWRHHRARRTLRIGVISLTSPCVRALARIVEAYPQKESAMIKFLGKTAGIIFLIGLAVVIGLLMLIF